MNLYVWENKTTPNFGDAINLPLMERLTGQPMNPVQENVQGKLVASGSVLWAARPGDTVWGTGVHPLMIHQPEKTKFWVPEELTIKAVRGPLTRDFILGHGHPCPEVYVDPAQWIPEVWKAPSQSIRRGVGLIPHYSDGTGASFSQGIGRDGFKIIPARNNDWEGVLLEILTCEWVASSSLHGIIVAEAFGIPAVWVSCSEGLEKYLDYYWATGRSPSPINWVDVPLLSGPTIDLPQRKELPRWT